MKLEVLPQLIKQKECLNLVSMKTYGIIYSAKIKKMNYQTTLDKYVDCHDSSSFFNKMKGTLNIFTLIIVLNLYKEPFNWY